MGNDSIIFVRKGLSYPRSLDDEALYNNIIINSFCCQALEDYPPDPHRRVTDWGDVVAGFKQELIPEDVPIIIGNRYKRLMSIPEDLLTFSIKLRHLIKPRNTKRLPRNTTFRIARQEEVSPDANNSSQI